MYKFGPLQKKILLVLEGGILLGFANNPRQYYRNLRLIRHEWKKINQQNFKRSVCSLAKEKFIEERRKTDGTIELVLTKKGKLQAKRLNYFGNKIKFKIPKKWDKKWRLVIFDIPEKERIFRNILREHLKELDFRKLQNSVFVSPHPFENSILELVELYNAKDYVRVITAERIDNEEKIKKYFFKNKKTLTKRRSSDDE